MLGVEGRSSVAIPTLVEVRTGADVLSGLMMLRLKLTDRLRMLQLRLTDRLMALMLLLGSLAP